MPDISQPTSYSQRFTTFIIIPLLTIAIKIRKTGLIFLLTSFLTNYYFMLFDQATYIAFLGENLSPDGNITDINSSFFRLESYIIITATFLWLIDQPAIDLMAKRSQRTIMECQPQQNSLPYITACSLWLLISYLPYLFLDSQTIINLINEDGFFQNCGAAWLFISSILFFYLYYCNKEDQHLLEYNKRRNVWFLLLGLLFLFGAGEEISWAQRIFNYETPAFMTSNTQGEFNIHNLPWLNESSEKGFINEHNIWVSLPKVKFVESNLTISSFFFDFCFLSLLALPCLYLISNKIKVIIDTFRIPIAPIYSGLFFIVGYNISKVITNNYLSKTTQDKLNMEWESAQVNNQLSWSSTELYETFISFLFMTVAIWLINNRQKTRNGSAIN